MAQQPAGRPVHMSTEAIFLLYKYLLNKKKKKKIRTVGRPDFEGVPVASGYRPHFTIRRLWGRVSAVPWQCWDVPPQCTITELSKAMVCGTLSMGHCT